MIPRPTGACADAGPGRAWSCDVLVIGGGNAGLCAALAARRGGASVLLVEQAPRELRGGNSRHTRNLRLAHDAPSVHVREAYSADEFFADLVHATGGQTDAALARRMIAESACIPQWMEHCGVRYQAWRDGAPPSRKTAFLLGGGKALVNAYYLAAARLGVKILYDSEVPSLRLEGGRAREATVVTAGVATKVQAKTVVVASGGMQANLDWLRQHWGEAADRFVIRGTPYARGEVLKNLLDQGVAPAGDAAHCHMVAVDARSPKFDGGIVTRFAGVPFGIVVDRDGRRFHDEGAEVGPRRYALWGALIARCPGQIAHAIFDAKAEALFRSPIYPPVRAETVAELAPKLALDPAALSATIAAYNEAVRIPPGDAAHASTENLVPPKTRFALPINTPPFASYPLRPGLTFCSLGVKVDDKARVLMTDGRAVKNLFAAGLTMTGNILGRGYLAGLGLTIGTVFGRIAGEEAARHAH